MTGQFLCQLCPLSLKSYKVLLLVNSAIWELHESTQSPSRSLLQETTKALLKSEDHTPFCPVVDCLQFWTTVRGWRHWPLMAKYTFVVDFDRQSTFQAKTNNFTFSTKALLVRVSGSHHPQHRPVVTINLQKLFTANACYRSHSFVLGEKQQEIRDQRTCGIPRLKYFKCYKFEMDFLILLFFPTVFERWSPCQKNDRIPHKRMRG